MAREAIALMLEVPIGEVAVRVEWREPFFGRTSKRLRNETFAEAKEAVWREQHGKLRALMEQRWSEAGEG
jgi:hypothetical protein